MPISGVDPTPRPTAVYASNDALPRRPQDSLPSCLLGFGRTRLALASSHQLLLSHPASGFPTGFSPRHTAGTEFGVCCRSSGRSQTRPTTPISVRLRRRLKLLQKRPDTQGCSRLIANHRSSAPSKAHQKQGPLPPQALPGLNGHMSHSNSRPTRRLCDGEVASPSRDGSPPLTRITLPTCRAPYPGGSRRVPASIASPLT